MAVVEDRKPNQMAILQLLYTYLLQLRFCQDILTVGILRP